MRSFLARLFGRSSRPSGPDRGGSRDADFFWFQCLRCAKVYPAPEAGRGRKSRCPSCDNVALLPEAPRGGCTVPCPLCGERIAPAARMCRHCGEFFGGAVPCVRESPARRWGRWFRRRPAPAALQLGWIPVDRVEANPYQPRERVEPGALRRLCASVRAYGVIVPIIVRPLGRGRFQLVAGQRRLAAARAVGLRTVPALVRPCSQTELLEVGYLENLHREELSAVENAQAFERLAAESPERPASVLASRLGRAAQAVAAERRLLRLPVLLQEAVAQRMIDPVRAEELAGVREADALRALEAACRGARGTAEESAA